MMTARIVGILPLEISITKSVERNTSHTREAPNELYYTPSQKMTTG